MKHRNLVLATGFVLATASALPALAQDAATGTDAGATATTGGTATGGATATGTAGMSTGAVTATGTMAGGMNGNGMAMGGQGAMMQPNGMMPMSPRMMRAYSMQMGNRLAPPMMMDGMTTQEAWQLRGMMIGLSPAERQSMMTMMSGLGPSDRMLVVKVMQGRGMAPPPAPMIGAMNGTGDATATGAADMMSKWTSGLSTADQQTLSGLMDKMTPDQKAAASRMMMNRSTTLMDGSLTSGLSMADGQSLNQMLDKMSLHGQVTTREMLYRMLPSEITDWVHKMQADQATGMAGAPATTDAATTTGTAPAP